MVEALQDTHKREEGSRLKAGAGPLIGGDVNKIGGDLKFNKNPAFIKERRTIFDELFAV